MDDQTAANERQISDSAELEEKDETTPAGDAGEQRKQESFGVKCGTLLLGILDFILVCIAASSLAVGTSGATYPWIVSLREACFSAQPFCLGSIVTMLICAALVALFARIVARMHEPSYKWYSSVGSALIVSGAFMAVLVWLVNSGTQTAGMDSTSKLLQLYTASSAPFVIGAGIVALIIGFVFGYVYFKKQRDDEKRQEQAKSESLKSEESSADADGVGASAEG